MANGIDIQALSRNIRDEATGVLESSELMALLSKYGEPFYYGSYDLDLMVWKDIDLLVKVNGRDTSALFDLGAKLAQRLDIAKLKYRDEYLLRTPNVPTGLLLSFEAAGGWKFDIWFFEKEVFDRKMKRFKETQKKVNAKNRRIILKLKNVVKDHSEYTKTIRSVHLYESVLNYDVRSVDDFSIWLREHEGIDAVFE